MKDPGAICGGDSGDPEALDYGLWGRGFWAEALARPDGAKTGLC